MMAIPLMILYEISIVGARVFQKRKASDEDEEEDNNNNNKDNDE